MIQLLNHLYLLVVLIKYQVTSLKRKDSFFLDWILYSLWYLFFKDRTCESNTMVVVLRSGEPYLSRRPRSSGNRVPSPTILRGKGMEGSRLRNSSCQIFHPVTLLRRGESTVRTLVTTDLPLWKSPITPVSSSPNSNPYLIPQVSFTILYSPKTIFISSRRWQGDTLKSVQGRRKTRTEG